MSSRRKLYSQLSSFDKGLRKERQEIAGMLGIPLGGEQVVEVATRASYVYVRLRDSQNEVIQAFNDQVASVYNLPVLVTREGGKYKVLGRDTERYSDWGTSYAYLPKHGNTHSRNPFISSGGDVVWVFSNQFMPWLVQPSGTNGAANVVVNGGPFLQSNGAWRYDGITGTASLLSYKPTGSNNAVMVLIYENMDTGVLGYSAGTEFSSAVTGTAGVIPYIPALSNSNLTPLAAVRLVSGTRTIGWDNIYDVRQWLGSRRGGAFNIYDEGILLGEAASIDFVGPGVDATISGTRARISIPGGGTLTGTFNLSLEDVSGQFISGTPVNHFTLTGTVQLDTDRLYYNGVRQQRTTHYVMDGNGQGFTTNFTGSYDDVLIMDYGSALAGGGSTSVAIQDEGVPQGNVATFNFVGPNVDASVSGSVVRVFVSGSSGGAAGGLTLIQEITPSGIPTGTFSNIPSSYSALKILFSIRTEEGAVDVTSLYMYFNQDYVLNHYRAQLEYAQDGTLVAGIGSDSPITAWAAAGLSPSGTYASGEISVPFYSFGTANKNALTLGLVRRKSSTPYLATYRHGMEWFYSAPVSRIDIVTNSGANFVTGTIMRLYGMT